VRGAPAKCCHRRHLLSSLQQFLKFSRDERPGGILPAFAWSDVASRLVSRTLLTGSTPIPPITGRHWLSPPSSTRRPISVPRGSLSLTGRPVGLPRFVQVPVWVRFCLSAGGAASAMGELGAPIPDPLPFWPKPVSILWLVASHDVYQQFTYVNHATPFQPPSA